MDEQNRLNIINEYRYNRDWQNFEIEIMSTDKELIDEQQIIHDLMYDYVPFEMLEIVLKIGADPNIPNIKNRTPIFNFNNTENGLKKLKLLIDYNADLNFTDFYEDNFLFDNFQEDVFLLSKKFDFNYYHNNEHKNNIFHKIALGGFELKRTSEYDFLHIDNLDTYNKNGLSPLHIAVINFDSTLIKQYIKLGFDKNKETLKESENPHSDININIPKSLNSKQILEFYLENQAILLPEDDEDYAKYITPEIMKNLVLECIDCLK